jgi:hypothetical protein
MTVYEKFEVSSAVTMKNAVFWDVTTCGFRSRLFGGMYCLYHQAEKNRRARSIVSSNKLIILMMVAIQFSEISDFTRSTRRNIPHDGVLHTHRLENLKYSIALTGWAL